MGGQFFRYVVNGLLATAIHFSVLTFNLNVLGIGSAGVANGIAAIFGIPDYDLYVFRGAGTVCSLEFGALPVTEPDIHPPTRNPWQPGFSAGGSSGGSG